jgi:hypothetical protein
MSTHANIIHYANVEDESTGEAFEVFQFVKVGGRRDRLIVERGLADDPKQVRLHLRNRNAALSPAFNESIREVEAAIRAEPLGLLRYAARNGWLADNTGFVNSSGTIDSKDRQQEILPPPAGSTPRSAAAGSRKATCKVGSETSPALAAIRTWR